MQKAGPNRISGRHDSRAGVPATDDNTPTPRHGSASVSMRSYTTRATRGISIKHWKGAWFVLFVLLLVFVSLFLFLAYKGEWFRWAGG